MASLISLGFRSTKYVHPTRFYGHGKTEETQIGWTPIRSVIAVAEDRERRRPLAADLRDSAVHHCLTSKRVERSTVQYAETLLRFKTSGIKRALRKRQSLPVVQA